MKNSIVNIFLVLVSVVLGLLIIDRMVLWAFPITGIYALDDETDYAMKKNISIAHSSSEYQTRIETNSFGLRDADRERDGRCAVLVLGDSFSFGYGVNNHETFPRHLENLLEANYPSRYKVINAGHNGFDTQRELAFMRKHFDRIQPKAIILQFFLNDILSNSGQFYFSPVSGGLLSRLPFAGLDALFTYTTRYPKKLLFKLGLNPDYREIEHYDCLQNNACEAGWKATGSLIREYAEFGRKNNVQTFVLRIPAVEELSVPGGSEAQKQNLSSETLTHITSENNVSYIDLGLAPELSKADYYPIDGHLTPDGNQLTAEWIFRKSSATWSQLSHSCPTTFPDDD
jgi:lysophospholipase L1-like esterase